MPRGLYDKVEMFLKYKIWHRLEKISFKRGKTFLKEGNFFIQGDLTKKRGI